MQMAKKFDKSGDNCNNDSKMNSYDEFLVLYFDLVNLSTSFFNNSLKNIPPF